MPENLIYFMILVFEKIVVSNVDIFDVYIQYECCIHIWLTIVFIIRCAAIYNKYDASMIKEQ